MNKQAIGIFDSGVGGLSVWKELIKVLPNENMIYYADSGNCPYGAKSQQDIISLSKNIVDFFISKNVKLVVVACNTATAAAIEYLRSNYDIPFIGMEPAIKPAAKNTENGIVGVLATEGTFGGRLFLETSEKWASNVKIEILVGKGFVELVEDADFDSKKCNNTIKRVIEPLLEKNIDQLVLACTHYPFLCDSIKKITKNNNIEIINPAPAVARHTFNILKEKSILNKNQKQAHYQFFSSGNLKTLELLVHQINSDINSCFDTL